MNLNYAIFRSEPIYTIPDLAQIRSHNKREKKVYQSNKDIKIELSKKIDNIKENKIVLTTSKYIGEGYDNSFLEVLFLTMTI